MLLERLKKQSGLSDNQLERLAETASKRYKTFSIPKRTGGFRTINQPTRQIKSIQRWLVKAISSKFPLHNCATAYSSGSSIKKNAERHLLHGFTLRVDFESFFPSFQASHVKKFLTDKSIILGFDLTRADIDFATRIFCRFDMLTIGAPSSPTLTNLMMFEFDDDFSNWCAIKNLMYSRYADDIFVSSLAANQLPAALSKIEEISKTYKYASLKINNEKTKFLSRRYRRSITGLIITPDGRISIGLERKNKIKNELYDFQHGRLTLDQIQKLRGMLAFVGDVEPAFYGTLVRKYSQSVIDQIEAVLTPAPPML